MTTSRLIKILEAYSPDTPVYVEAPGEDFNDQFYCDGYCAALAGDPCSPPDPVYRTRIDGSREYSDCDAQSYRAGYWDALKRLRLMIDQQKELAQCSS